MFEKLCIKINELTTWLKDKGIALECINVGGGLGVDYHAPDANAVVDFKAYFQLFNRLLKREVHQRVQFEPGRSIVAQCGALISRVLYIKKGQTKHFVILDAGMTELIRPALYQSFHKIENLSASNEQAVHRSAQIYEVVGPICETSDSFGKEVILPETHRGDLIAIRSTGAYGETMASGYNLRDKAKCVYSTQL